MKKHKTLIIISILCIIGYILFLKKDEIKEYMESDSDDSDSIPEPPKSEVLPNKVNFANNGFDGQYESAPIAIDPYSEQGLEAIKGQIRAIERKPELKNEVIATIDAYDIFDDISDPEVKTIIRNEMTNGTGSMSDVPISSSYTNPQLVRDIDKMLEYASQYPSKVAALGGTAAIDGLMNLTDFRNTAGFSLTPKGSLDGIVSSDSGYSDCNGFLWGNRRKKECRYGQHAQFARDVVSVGENLKSYLNKYDDAIFDAAVMRLMSGGWNFIGY